MAVRGGVSRWCDPTIRNLFSLESMIPRGTVKRGCSELQCSHKLPLLPSAQEWVSVGA